jgi:hypothetical protein
MKAFIKSEHTTRKMLYKAKAEYYEKLCKQLVDELVLAQVLVYDKANDEYYWEANGDRLGDDL